MESSGVHNEDMTKENAVTAQLRKLLTFPATVINFIGWALTMLQSNINLQAVSFLMNTEVMFY